MCTPVWPSTLAAVARWTNPSFLYESDVCLVLLVCCVTADDDWQGLTEITLDEAVSQQILDASRASMGMDTSDIDMLNIDSFATR